MTGLAAIVVGVLFAAGLLLVVSGLSPPAHVSTPKPRRAAAPPDWGRRAALAVALAAGVLALTRWPVAAGAAGLGGWFAPELFGRRHEREQAVARTEAIASWTEMLRDTMAGAHGLEEAIRTTALVAPEAIQAEVTALAVRLERQSLTDGLHAFADDLAHPTGDLVVTALLLAADGAVGDLTELLGTLALTAREEAAMRLRVEAARARIRTAVKVIATVTAATAGGLIVLNRSYLAAYSTPEGQVALAAVAACWGAGLWWLSRLGDYLVPTRFLAVAQRDEATR